MRIDGLEAGPGSVIDIPSGSTLPSKVQEGNLFLLTTTPPMLHLGLAGGWRKVIVDTSMVPENAGARYFSETRVWSSPLSSLPLGSTSTVAVTDSLLTAIGKLQAQHTAHVGSVDGHPVVTTSSNGLMLATDKVILNTHVGSTSGHPVVTTTTNGFMLATDKVILNTHVGSTTGHPVATAATAGFMAAGDKSNLDGHLNSTNGHPTVTTTTNGFMLATDKVILNNHVGAASGHPNATQSANGFMAATDKAILDNHVGAASGHPNATQSANGFMSAADKAILDNHVGTATGHTVATASTQGFMSATDKSNLDGHLNSTTGHPVVTTTANGFMSAADKVKLDGQLSTRKYLSADTANAQLVANTLQTISDLSFPVIVGQSYTFKFLVPFTAAAATTGSRWTITGPTASVIAYVSRYPLTATTETVNYAGAYGIPAACNASSLTAGNVAIIEGMITPTAAGTVSLQFASEVTLSAITAKAGAYVSFTSH